MVKAQNKGYHGETVEEAENDYKELAMVLASGENRHSGSGRNSHLGAERKRQCTNRFLNS